MLTFDQSRWRIMSFLWPGAWILFVRQWFSFVDGITLTSLQGLMNRKVSIA